MAFLPVTLGVSRGPSPLSGRTEAEVSALKTSVLERDGHTCQYCGFTSKRYQDIRPKAEGKPAKKTGDFATACIFCAQCFELDKAAQMKSGTLIWLPEIGQAALHHILRAVYIARIAQGRMAEAARHALDALLTRREEALVRLGTDDPLLLGAVMQDFLEDADYAHRIKKLEGIRLLPLDRRIINDRDMEFNQFPQILAYWRSKDGPFGGVLPATWEETFADIVSKAG